MIFKIQLENKENMVNFPFLPRLSDHNYKVAAIKKYFDKNLALYEQHFYSLKRKPSSTPLLILFSL